MTVLRNIIALTATLFIVVSCAPAPPEAAPVIEAIPVVRNVPGQAAAAKAAEERAEARAKARKRAQEKKKKELARRAEARRKAIEAKKTRFEAPAYREPQAPAPVKKKPSLPVAKAIPSKPGFVFNPYTYDPVDVRGVPSGSTVIDPNDPDKSHQFIVK